MATTINALITTFPGLPNLTLPLPDTTPIHILHTRLRALLPPTPHRLLLTTASGTPLPASSPHPLSTLLPHTHTTPFLPLRLTLALPGGKGGFGSQLRAAGGRMSSRKKRGQQENNDSCRNLDGRRMRTVKEAKALAAYLEIKPDMERKERERRRERAMKVIEAAERREGGGGGKERRFEDVKWLEETEEERERTRGAVERAMREGFTDRVFVGGEGGAGGSSGSGSDESDDGEGSAGARKVVPRFAGWDEDDEFLSSDDDEEEEEEEQEEEEGEGGDDGENKGMEDIQEEDEEEEEECEGKGKGKGKA